MCNKIHYKIIYNWLGTIFVFLRCYSTIFVCLGFVFLQTPRNNSKNIRHLKFSTRRIVEGAKFTHPRYLFSVCTPCAIRSVHAGREKDLRTFFPSNYGGYLDSLGRGDLLNNVTCMLKWILCFQNKGIDVAPRRNWCKILLIYSCFKRFRYLLRLLSTNLKRIKITYFNIKYAAKKGWINDTEVANMYFLKR